MASEMPRSNSFNLLATGISVLTAKIIPLIISMYLVLKMSVDDYADWIYLFQCVLFASSGLGTLINTEFSKKYKPDEYKRLQLSIYIGSHDKYVLSVLILAIVLLLVNYGTIIVILSVLLFILNVFNNYILLALRFSGKFSYLVLLSAVRLFSFLPILCVQNVSLYQLALFMLISLIISNILIFYKFEITIKKYKSGAEMLWLLSYGLVTSIFITFERFYLKLIGTEPEEYSTIVYVVSLVMIVIPIVEVVKQYLVPSLYLKYQDKSYSFFKDTKVLTYLGILFVVQILLPISVYFILYKLNGLPIFMENFAFTNIFILSFGYAIFSLYHFLNPAFFLSNASRTLLFSQIIGIAAFISLLFFGVSFYISKLIALTLVIVMIALYRERIKYSHG